MGGGGASSGAGGSNYATSAISQQGEVIDLSDSPLKYGKNDRSVSGKVREAIEEFEDKYIKGKIEQNLDVDINGIALSQKRGGRSKVKVNLDTLIKAYSHTHIHPRSGPFEAKALGGTFSEADIKTFANYARNYRAKAAEGTYSITRNKNFNAQGLINYYSSAAKVLHSAYKSTMSTLNAAYERKEISIADYRKNAYKAFNKWMVESHNTLLKGQKQFGYRYVLERPRKK